MSGPVDNWLAECDLARAFVDVYSDDFLQSFERSDFYTVCKNTVAGKLKWKEWSDCSVSCGGGTQTKIASSCVPDYAICYGIQISERTCEEQACPIGQWRWNDWSECTASCNGGIRFKTAHSCQPLGAECKEVPVINESCNTIACQDGQWTWNDWGECSHSCGGGVRIKIAQECLPHGAFCNEIPIQEEICNEDACPIGTWIWNEWSDCSVSCGGGRRTRIAKSCEPSNALCDDVPILEESCNPSSCPDLPSPYLPAGTIISWVPRPNANAPESVYFNDDTWIECNGNEKCKSGRFKGQSCTDLSDRVLVGAGEFGQLLQVKDASLPDHAHNHRHIGTKAYSIAYDKGPSDPGSGRSKTTDSVYNRLTYSRYHRHDENGQTTVNVNFGDMSEEATLISNFKNPNSKVKKSSGDNELYSPHMRVTFMFKCY